jgi:hypothetical protein
MAGCDLTLCGWAIGKLQDDLRLAASETTETKSRRALDLFPKLSRICVKVSHAFFRS